MTTQTSQIVRSIAMPPAIDDALRLAAYEERKSMSAILREAFTMWDAQRHADKVMAIKHAVRTP